MAYLAENSHEQQMVEGAEMERRSAPAPVVEVRCHSKSVCYVRAWTGTSGRWKVAEDGRRVMAGEGKDDETLMRALRMMHDVSKLLCATFWMMQTVVYL